MDPVTVIGLAASIAQLIKATSKVIKYVDEVKDAPSQRENLDLETANFMPLLVMLKQRTLPTVANEEWISSIRSLGAPEGPIPQLEASMSQLAEKLKIRKKKRGGDLRWPSDKKECTAILSKIERTKLLIGLALQDDLLNLTLALKEDFGTVSENVKAITKNITQLKIQQHSVEDQKVLGWLSSRTFGDRQRDVYEKMTVGTGNWIFETPEFQSFMATNDKMLLCTGMPGAAKTVLTSCIVNHLETAFFIRNIGIAYVYCNYKEPDQTAGTLMMSLLRQAVQSKHTLPDQINDLYNTHLARKTRPSLAEITDLIRVIAQTYSRGFILIDALDEYREQDETQRTLISALQHLGSDVHLLVTTRHVLLIESEFGDAMRVEIRASDKNIAAYLLKRIDSAKQIQSIIASKPDLQSQIIEKITKNCQGMFLMAMLHMNSLLAQRNVTSVRVALENLPAKLDDTYSQTLERIKGQTDVDARIAHETLIWVVHATRPLKLREVQHALAVRPGQTEFDEEAIIDEEILVSVCLGLITIDQASQCVRLVHFTAQKYLERTRLESLSDPHHSIMTTCLSYLSFSSLNSNILCGEREDVPLLHQLALLDYAARKWGHHASHAGLKSNDQVLDYLNNQMLFNSTTIALTSKWTWRPYTPRSRVCGLHLAAHFGLPHALEQLLEKGANIDCSEHDFHPALHVASSKGDLSMVQLLLKRGAAMNQIIGKRSPLHLAAEAGHLKIVNLLLDWQAEIDIRYSRQTKTSLLSAVEGRQLAAVQTLLGKGADSNATADDDILKTEFITVSYAAHKSEIGIADALPSEQACTALCLAVRAGREPMVALLLERGADTNVCCQLKGGPLGHAVRYQQENIAHLLSTKGADGTNIKGAFRGLTIKHDEKMMRALSRAGVDVDSITTSGGSPLLFAAKAGDVDTVQFLYESGANIDLRHHHDFPLYAANRYGNEQIVQQLLLWDANPRRISEKIWLRKAIELSKKKAEIGEQEYYSFTRRRWAQPISHAAWFD